MAWNLNAIILLYSGDGHISFIDLTSKREQEESLYPKNDVQMYIRSLYMAVEVLSLQFPYLGWLQPPFEVAI